MKKTLFAFCLALLVPTATFSGIGEAQLIKTHFIEKPLEKLTKKLHALGQNEVVFHVHIPSLATFATAKLPKDSLKLDSSAFPEHEALTNRNILLPHEKNAFWYAFLKGDSRVMVFTPSTAPDEIKKTIEEHGQLVSYENAHKKNELEQKIHILNDTLSKLDTMMATHKKSAQK